MRMRAPASRTLSISFRLGGGFLYDRWVFYIRCMDLSGINTAFNPQYPPFRLLIKAFGIIQIFYDS